MGNLRGPKPNPTSLSAKGTRKSFYVNNAIWERLNYHCSTAGKHKSFVINEALQTYLAVREQPQASTNAWTVVSLFSGCGGMDLGFVGDFSFMGQHYNKFHQVNTEDAAHKSFEVVFSNDILKEACVEYANYFGHYPICQDITEYLDALAFQKDIFPAEADVVIGGFPCQDFSVAGKRKGLDADRGRLYQQMRRVVELTNPKIFIAENVKGLTNLGSALEVIVQDFAATGIFGYDIDYKLHQAADFGVPQTRERVFIRGVRKDLDPKAFTFPLEQYSADPEDTGLPKWVNAQKALGDLSDNRSVKNQDQVSKARNYGVHCQGNKRIRADYPAPTIRAEHHGNIEFHYDASLNRRLTVRECARLQSFPDEFVFVTSPSKAYKLIGNAVPPVLAWHIAKSVAQALSKWEANVSRSRDNIPNHVGDQVQEYHAGASTS